MKDGEANADDALEMRMLNTVARALVSCVRQAPQEAELVMKLGDFACLPSCEECDADGVPVRPLPIHVPVETHLSWPAAEEPRRAHRDALVSNGAVKAVLACLECTDVGVLSMAFRALGWLAHNADGALQVCRALKAVFPFIGHGELGVRLWATWASRWVVSRAGATMLFALHVPALVELLEDPSPVMIREAACLTAAVFNQNEHVSELAEGDGLPALLVCLRSPDVHIRRAAAASVMSFARVRRYGDVDDAFICSVCSCLKEEAAGDGIRLETTLALCETIARIGHTSRSGETRFVGQGIVPVLMALLDRRDMTAHGRETVMWSMRGAMRQCKELSALACEHGIMEALMALQRRTDAVAEKCSCATVVRVVMQAVQDRRAADAAIKAGWVDQCIEWVTGADDALRIEACDTLSALAWSAIWVGEAVCKAGALASIARCLRMTATSPQCRISATRVLARLADDFPRNCLAIKEAGLLPTLLHILETDAPEVVEMAVEAVSHMVQTSKECRDALYRLSCVPVLLECLTHTPNAVRYFAAKSLANILREIRCTKDVLKDPLSVSRIVDTLRATEPRTVNMAAAICIGMSDDDSRIALAEGGAIHYLLAATNGVHEAMACTATAALENLTRCDPICTIVCHEGGIGQLIQLMQQHEKYQDLCLYALCVVENVVSSRNRENLLAFKLSGGMDVLTKCAQCPFPAVAKKARRLTMDMAGGKSPSHLRRETEMVMFGLG